MIPAKNVLKEKEEEKSPSRHQSSNGIPTRKWIENRPVTAE
jgi:hypothetical protein